MSENKNDLYDFMRGQLSDYREAPPEAVWTEVAKALDNKKSKRRIFFWLILLGMGSTASLLVFKFTALNQNQAVHNLNSFSSIFFIKSTPLFNKDIKSESVTLHSPNDILYSANKGNSLQNQPVVSSPSVKDLKTETTSNINTTGKNVTTETAITSTDNIKPDIGQEISIHESIAVNKSESELIYLEKEKTLLFSQSFMPVLHSESDLGLINHSINQENPNCKWIPFMGVEAGTGALGYHIKQSQYSSGSLGRQFGNHSFITVLSGFRYKENLIFSAGIGYENLYSTHNYKANYFSNSLTNDVMSEPGMLPFGQLNVVIPSNVEFLVSATPSEDGLVKFNSHYLHIPMTAGYQKSIKKFSLGIHAGPALHILLSQKAQFITLDGEERQIILNSPNSVNVSLGIKPHVGYRLGQFELFTAGDFRYRFMNIWKSSESRVMPYNLSGSIGLRYHLRCR
ncbi:MAG: PorT family protein [Flavobacteriales bacterium]|nr:PorT family protein [Flavobacteriales bacterium]